MSLGREVNIFRVPGEERRQIQHHAIEEAMRLNGPKDTDVDGMYEMIIVKNSTTEEMKETLRTLTKSLTMKRQVITKLNNSKKWKYKQKALSAYKTMSYSLNKNWQEWQYNIRDLLFTWNLWYYHLKSIQGHFGTGVASYFYFLRWLFICNASLFTTILCFIIIPQSLYPSAPNNSSSENEDFTGKEFLTGAGYFTYTLMYFGYYTNGTVGSVIHYNIPEAYFLTMATFFLLWLIILAYCLAHSYQQEYVENLSIAKSLFSNKIFAGWDFAIETEEAAKLKSRSVYNELLETLSRHKGDADKEVTISTKMVRFMQRVLINIVVLLTMAGVGYLVYYILESEKLQTHIHFLKEMALSLTITTIMLVLPLFYMFISKYEVSSSKLVKLYVAIIRIVILELVVLGIIVYFQLFSRKKTHTHTECWETEFGQEIYRLLMVDFIFIVIFHTLFGEVFRCILHKFHPKLISNTEFHIDWNTLNLIYSQTLTWLGVFYCPLLPLVTLVKLFVLFYMKRISVALTCKPSSKPWHALHVKTLFLGLTFINFMLALIAVIFSIFRAKISNCGPFQHFETHYSIILNILDKLEESGKLGTIVKYIFAPGFVSVLFILFCVLVYYMRVKAKARMDVVLLLRKHALMEGNDKTFLLKMIEKSNWRNSASQLSKSSSAMLYSKHNSGSSVSNEEAQSPHQDIVNELYEDYSLNRHSGTEIRLPATLIGSSYDTDATISPINRYQVTQSPWKRNKKNFQHSRF